MYLSYKYLSKVVLFFNIEQPEPLNSYKVKISVVAYVMKRQSLNESGNTSSFTGCSFYKVIKYFIKQVFLIFY